MFTGLRTFDFDANAKHVKSYRDMARDDYGRDVRVWGLVNIVQGETEKEARDFYNYYVHEKGDWEAANNMVNTMGAEINQRNYTPEIRKFMAEQFVSSWVASP